MFGLKQKLSVRFYSGVLLIVFSFIIAKIVQVIFFLHFDNLFWRWFSIAVYVLTWPMLVVGVWWVGKEYAEQLRKYFQYKFYREAMKNKSRAAYLKTMERTKMIKEKLRNGLEKVKRKPISQ